MADDIDDDDLDDLDDLDDEVEESEDDSGDSDDEGEDEPDEEPEPEQKKLFGKIPIPGKMGLIIIGVVGLLVVAGGGMFAMGLFSGAQGDEELAAAEAQEVDLGTPVYYEQPVFVADLKTDECRGPLLKLGLTFQIDEEEDYLESRQPKILDRIQQHLRSLSKHELSGEEGANKLRAAITLIVNGAIKPAKVQNVLFRSFVVQ